MKQSRFEMKRSEENEQPNCFYSDSLKREKNTIPPFISVIICTYNRATLLKRTLGSLVNQTLSPNYFEVIVVDDGSSDGTGVVCTTMLSVLPNLRYFSNGGNKGLAWSRNRGIAEACGDYLLFTDDDCITAEDWVERSREALKLRPIIAGCVSSTVSNYFTLCHNIAHFHPFMPGQQAGPREFIAGANMAMRRSVLEDLGGFNSSLRHAEDMEFVLRARSNGYSVYFAPDAVVVHDPARTTLRSIVKYSAEHAAETILLRNRYRALLRTPLIVRSPILLLAATPLIAMKVTVGIYLRNQTISQLFWTAPIVFLLKLGWCWGAAYGLRKSYRNRREL